MVDSKKKAAKKSPGDVHVDKNGDVIHTVMTMDGEYHTYEDLYDHRGYPRHSPKFYRGMPIEERRSAEVASATGQHTMATFAGVSPSNPFPRYGDAADIVRHEHSAAIASAKVERFVAKISDAEKSAFERMGVKFLGPNQNKLFVNVTLPEGWKFEPSKEDSRTVDLLDQNGRKRGYYWYKAAAYDEAAYGGLVRRYEVNNRNFDNYTREVGYVLDKLNDRKVVFQTEAKFAKDRDYFDDDSKTVNAVVKEWLKTNLPDYMDPCAYWDDPALPFVGTFPPYR